jgi:hypothetical protein
MPTRKGAMGSTMHSGTRESKTSIQYSGRMELGGPKSVTRESLGNSI